jgi:23S rRNA (adenine-N6)-dimethyltransferase
MSRIGLSDTVYEIGPGNGIITAVLARAAANVIAIEKDPELVRRLNERFGQVENITIIEGDFLDYSFVRSRYKIFGNIPYNRTAQIVRKILYEKCGPCEAYLIMQKEPAKKFCGSSRETLFSILIKPFFELQILTQLKRTDFWPVPKIDSVLLSIKRRDIPFIARQDASLYRRFVHYGFDKWKPKLRLSFKNVFTYKQWRRLARDLAFPLNATPTELNVDQWLGLYREFKHRSDVRNALACHDSKNSPN